MYCPECLVEYRDGFTECADCHVPLHAGAPPPRNQPPSNPDLPLVVVLETNDAFLLALAKGALEEAGISFFVLNEISMLVTDIDPMLRKWVRVQVASDREEEARNALAPLLEPGTGAEDAGAM